MSKKWLLRVVYLLIIPAVIVLFVYNIVTHGIIEHPGKSTYTTKCAQCHGDNGEGIEVLIPPLAKADFAISNFDSIPCWLKNGISHPIKVNGIEYDQPMYPMGLDDIQTANLMNYLSSEMFGIDSQVNSAWVREKLKGCK